MSRLNPKQFAIFIVFIIIVLFIFYVYRGHSKQKDYQEKMDIIVDATMEWLSDRQSIIGDETHMTINLYLLKQDGYIENNLKNPNTRSNFSNNMMISIKKEKDEYQVSVLDDDIPDVSLGAVDVKAPRILLRGDYVTDTEINEGYIDHGVIAYSPDGGQVYGIDTIIKKDDRVVSSVDASKINTYDIQYKAEYAKLYQSIYRVVNVCDTKAPKIKAPKLEITLDQVDGLDLMSGVVVTDNSNSNVDVTYEGSVSKKVGKYTITYKAVDESGNVKTKKRVIRVLES